MGTEQSAKEKNDRDAAAMAALSEYAAFMEGKADEATAKRVFAMLEDTTSPLSELLERSRRGEELFEEWLRAGEKQETR